MTALSSSARKQERSIRMALVLAGTVMGGLVVLSPSAAITAGLVTTAAAMSGLILYLKPILILYGLMLLVPLVSGLERGRLVPMLRPNEPLLVAAVLGAVLAGRRIRSSGLRSVDLAILLYLVFGSIVPLLMHFVRSGEATLSELIPFVAPWQYPALCYLIISFGVTPSQAKRCLQLMVVAGVIIAVIAVLQMTKIDPVISLLTTYYNSPHLMRVEQWGYPRTTSLLANWHGTGVFLAFSALVVLAHHVAGSNLFRGWLAGLVLIVLIAGMITTTSMTSVVVIVTGIIIIQLSTKTITVKWLLFLVPMVLLISSLLFRDQVLAQIGKQFAGQHGLVPKTIAYRIDNWREQFLPLIEKHWMLGYGAEFSDNLVSVPSEDSQFVYMLLKGGILYLVAFLVFMVVTIRCLWQLHRDATRPEVKAVLLAAATLFTSIVPACFLQAYMTYSGVAEYPWVLLGLSSAIQRHVSTNDLHMADLN